jgi:hypothetical protein
MSYKRSSSKKNFMSEYHTESVPARTTTDRSAVAPVRVYQELAENGLLYDFLNEFMPGIVENDEAFRKEMYRIMLISAIEAIPGLEIAMLNDLAESLVYFNTTTSQWKQPKQSGRT